MSKLSKARKEFGQAFFDAPAGHTIDLELFDGETPIVAVPFHKTGKVVISISRALKLNATLEPHLALRLANYLAWAATEILMKRKDPPPAEAVELPKVVSQ